MYEEQRRRNTNRVNRKERKLASGKKMSEKDWSAESTRPKAAVNNEKVTETANRNDLERLNVDDKLNSNDAKTSN